MIVIVGSRSSLKIEATRIAFKSVYNDVVVKGLPIKSGVSPFPTSDEETLNGAMNRAKWAAEVEPIADFHVGLEGGLSRIGEWFVVKHFAVVVKGKDVGLGISPGYVCPDRLYRSLVATSDVVGRKAIDEFFKDHEILSRQGPIGVLTGGRLNRTQALIEAVTCALTRFIDSTHYL
jgi:inosine/xanthosine triphosphatase